MAIAPGAAQEAVAEGGPGEGPAPREGKSPTKIALERLRHDKVAMVCLGIIVIFVIIGALAPVWTGIVGVDAKPNLSLLNFDTGLGNAQSTPEHPFGVEQGTGRDLFYQWVYGARPSLIIGLLASALTIVIGVSLGLLAGYRGGWMDRLVSWLVDVTLSMPFLLVAIGVVPIMLNRFGSPDSSGYIVPSTESTVRFFTLVFVLVFFSWPQVARLVRGEVLSLREREFVQAARSLGMTQGRIVRKEVLPNLLGIVIVNFSILIPVFISAEAGLSFLGVGLKDPMFSWGQMIAGGVPYAQTYPIWMWIPTISLSLLVLALSLFGDAVSDAFNPQTRR